MGSAPEGAWARKLSTIWLVLHQHESVRGGAGSLGPVEGHQETGLTDTEVLGILPVEPLLQI